MTSSNPFPPTIQVIDSHTGGEPTRVVIGGGPDLGTGDLASQREEFRNRYDHYRQGIIREPRGSDIIVGALLCQPADPACAAGVIYFNNVGFLGMCGHGTIGLVVTLAHLGRMDVGRHLIETPVGIVEIQYRGGSRASVRNVASYRLAKDVQIDVPDYGSVTGDIAWGGNWFFLVSDHRETLEAARVNRLIDVTCQIRAALADNQITGADGAEIDHVELFTAAHHPQNDSRNFVLCPGRVFDRSPCGTGTSAKVACLIEDGKLKPGQTWRQESITGSLFEASAEIEQGRIIPTITGEAFVTGETTLLFHDDDPLRDGLHWS